MFIACMLLLVAGCSRTKYGDANVLATVNGEPITRVELQREMAMQVSRQIPARDQLDIMIHRKLLLQEAMRRRLPERETFVNTIRNFWEQTLIKELMDQMGAELRDATAVEEKDIQDFYSKLDNRVTFQIAHASGKENAQHLLEQARQGKSIAWDGQVGPSSYDEINVGALQKAFGSPMGEANIFEESGQYFVIRLSARQPVSRPPLGDIKEKIKLNILRQKEGMALQQWLAGVKDRANIRVFADRLGK